MSLTTEILKNCTIPLDCHFNPSFLTLQNVMTFSILIFLTTFTIELFNFASTYSERCAATIRHVGLCALSKLVDLNPENPNIGSVNERCGKCSGNLSLFSRFCLVRQRLHYSSLKEQLTQKKFCHNLLTLIPTIRHFSSIEYKINS